jgi:AhpD family alkylhydroperoxidase
MRAATAVLPGVMPAINGLMKAAGESGVPQATLELVHLRTSQINGCSFCVDYGVRGARKRGESEDRLFAVSAWRESPHFTEAERAALALSEEITRLADKGEAVPDEVFDEAAKHFDEKQLSGLILWIATTNMFNRINAPVRQPAGEPAW